MTKREYTRQEKRRLTTMCREKRIKRGERCPMDNCDGHLEETYPVLTDFSCKRRDLPIMVLMCSRESCDFRGIIPERFGARIQAWQKKGDRLREEAEKR